MRIFLVRHGHYDSDTGLLSHSGQGDVDSAARILRRESVHLGQVALLSSPVKRAQQTAEMLRVALGLQGFESVPWLVDGFDAKEAPEALMKMVSESPAASVIAVSHMSKINAIEAAFAVSFGTVFDRNPGYGSVHLVDLAERKITDLS